MSAITIVHTPASTSSDSSSSSVVFGRVILANHFFSRLKGLLGKKQLPENDAIVISPCHQVHTMGMRFSIDVMFIDKSNKVVKVVDNLKPYRQASNRNAIAVIEVAAGMASQHNINIGDKLTWTL